MIDLLEMSVDTKNSLIAMTCKKCGFQFKVEARFAGNSGRCPLPECQHRYTVPADFRRVAARRPKALEKSLDNLTNQTNSEVATRDAQSFNETPPRFWSHQLTVVLILLLLTATGAVYRVSSSTPRLFRGQNPDSENIRAATPVKNPPGVQLVALAQTEALKPVPPPKKKDDRFEKQVIPFLNKYCAECHGTELQEANIDLARFKNQNQALADFKTWEKVINILESAAMPPDDYESQPTVDDRKKVIDWIDSTFFNIDCESIHDPGRVTIRRLNRNEYNNTIRDLVGVDFKPAKDFPSDDVGYGFDNIGDVLSLPPLLMEKYLDAAEKITEAAIFVGDPAELTAHRVDGAKLLGKNAGGPVAGGFRSLSSTGYVSAEFNFSLEGEYIVRAEAAAQQAGPDKAKMEFRINGKKIGVHEIKGDRTPGMYETKFKIGLETPIAPGKKRIEAWFTNDYYNPKAKNPRDRDRNLLVRFLEVRGPLGLTEFNYPESHTRILVTKPGSAKTVEQAVREILIQFATRAYRRPVVASDIEPTVKLVTSAIEQGEEFEQGIRYGVQAILVSPHFLFRIENDPDPNNPKRSHKIQQYELASRLSYFLWSSMPDAELFELAGKSKLHDHTILEQQIKRMLMDPKSSSFVKNFAGQWLNLGLLDEATPNPKMFPEFTPELKKDMRRETELFFEEIMQKDRSILELIDGQFTYLNQRLAKHYGMENIQGNEFQRVNLPADRRAGILTQASILTLTSDPAKTLPVKRGKWILENLLGEPPPPPPANVPELAETQKANPKATLREQLELHRTNPTCASCHKMMDPLGLSLENFDPIGRWREKKGKLTIDASGRLPSGESFSGPAELLKILRKREAKFSEHLTRSMLTYALGRGLEYYDQCAVSKITDQLSQNNYQFSTLVLGIVTSDPFLMRRGDGGQQ